MSRKVFLFLIFFSSLFAERATTSVTENDPSTLVEGVSMITGDFCTYDQFHTVQGAEPIRFKSCYLTKGLFFTGHEHLIATFIVFSNIIELSEPNGTTVLYQDSPKNRRSIDKNFFGDPEKKKKWRPVTYTTLNFNETAQGLSNTASGHISGQTHLKNQRIVFHPEHDHSGKSFTLYASDGTIRRYAGLQSQPKIKIPHSGLFKDDEEYLTYRYKLLVEELPNGHVIHYEWGKDNSLMYIWTSNRSGKKVFSKIQMFSDPRKSLPSISGSDGKVFAAQFQPSPLKGKKIYAKVFPPEQPERSYSWISRKRRAGSEEIDYPYLQTLSEPDGRAIRLEYDEGDKDKIPRVSTLSSPVGKDETPLVTHRFFYDPEHRSSHVLDIEGNKTSYRWNPKERVSSIAKFIGPDQLHSRENFKWDGSLLTYKRFFDQDLRCLHARTFTYDDWGNVIKNTFYGNLSGRGSFVELDEKKNPLPSVESCSTQSSYTQDGKNLPLRIEEPGGLVTLFTYLPGTNLIQTKTLCDGSEPKIFYTYEYDEDFLLVAETMNDGIAAKIKRITPRQKDPYIGMPEVIEEKYLENGREHLLKKTVLHYRQGALIEHKDIYDADDIFQYRISYEYDEKNRIISETNALGQIAKASYDALGNRCYYKDVSGNFEQTSLYDYSNRLIETCWTDGTLSLKKEYSHDKKHRLEWESDERGHKTHYKYNLLGQRTETALSPIYTEAGKLITPKIQQEYNALGHEILRIDAEGYRTETQYNAYGKPIHVLHPNGLEEHFFYTLSGDLVSHIDPAGIETHYKYDYLQRIVEKTILSKNSELSKETLCYIGQHLVSKTDAEGNETTYVYDKAGRKIAETFGGETVRYEYDALGRVFRIEQGAEVTVKIFDLLDRVIEERQESLFGDLLKKVRFAYDSAGNKTASIYFHLDQEVKETCVYDALNRLIQRTNAEGFVESIYYEDVFNDYGQKVAQKTHIDATGLRTIETFDTYGRIAKVEKRKWSTLSLSEKFYSPKGHLILQIDTIFNPDGSSRKARVRWEHDCMGREIKIIEAEGTLDEKITQKTYTPKGELQKLIKPDGAEVFYEYNDLNQLTSIRSSEGTVDYQMTYNRLGHLQTSNDLTRITDPKGRVLQEIFPNGHTLQNTFDAFGRRISCCIPEADCLIEYDYQGGDLVSVTRKNLNGRELYAHHYLKRDLYRHVLEESLIGNQGKVQHTFDRLRRRIKVESPQFFQEILEFDPAGNILSMQLQESRRDYSYDDLHQLTEETGPFSHRYSYDSMHNRLAKDDEPYQVNALNQAVSHLDYDPNGCATSQGSTHYIYDALDRLIEIIAPTFIQKFTYDSLHRCLSKRTIKNHEPETLYFLYDGQKEIGAFNANLTIQELRILGATPEAERGAAIAVELKGQIFAPLHDLQGNLSALFPLETANPTYYLYSAFGEEKIIGHTLSPWRFSSKRSDSETHLVYYGRRFYLPQLGRWLTPDPSGFTDGMNLYAFLQNSPLTKMDLYGLFSWSKPDGTFNYLSSLPFSSPLLESCLFHAAKQTPTYKSEIFPALDPKSTGSPHYVVNGILNTPDEALEGAWTLHRSLGELSNIIPAYSATQGKWKDASTVMQCRNDPSYTNNFIERLRTRIVNTAAQMDQMNDPGKIFATGFSRGVGEIYHAVKNLPTEVKNRLIITCLGGILIIPRDCGFIVRNYISEGDGASRYLNGLLGSDEQVSKTLARYQGYADVQMLPQKDSKPWIGDHFFMSKTYQGVPVEETMQSYKLYGMRK